MYQLRDYRDWQTRYKCAIEYSLRRLSAWKEGGAGPAKRLRLLTMLLRARLQ